MILPDYGRNPISGRTLAEEIEIARGIGGKLPYCAFCKMIQRGIIKPRRKRRRSRNLKAKQTPPRQSR